jgi:hypothetical protein
VFGRVLGFVDGFCGRVWFSCGRFLGVLGSRSDIAKVVSAREVNRKATRLPCSNGNGNTNTTPKPFPVEPLREPCASFPFNPLPQSFHPVGTARNLHRMLALVSLSTRSARQQTIRPGSPFSVLAVEDLLQPHRISA